MPHIPRILSLDGGGIRGISSLQILKALMLEIREVHGMDEVPRPCDVFDIIGGTSTGGIIAIMLGRLGMSVENCINAYRALGETAFTPKIRLPLPGPLKGAYSSKALKAAIKQAIMDNCREQRCVATKDCHHADDIFQNASCTKTLVLAATKRDVTARPTLFRTYDTSSEFRDCSIWEVARPRRNREHPRHPSLNPWNAEKDRHRVEKERGLGDITLADWRMDSDISAHTHNYLKGQRAEILRFVNSLDDDDSTIEMQTPGLAHSAAEKRTQKNKEANASHDLCITCNSADSNSEQVNSITKVQPGSKATIADNVARNGSRQWNSISA